MKSGENCLCSFREGHLKISLFLQMYIAQRQEQITPTGQNFDCN